MVKFISSTLPPQNGQGFKSLIVFPFRISAKVIGIHSVSVAPVLIKHLIVLNVFAFVTTNHLWLCHWHPHDRFDFSAGKVVTPVLIQIAIKAITAERVDHIIFGDILIP